MNLALFLASCDVAHLSPLAILPKEASAKRSPFSPPNAPREPTASTAAAAPLSK